MVILQEANREDCGSANLQFPWQLETLDGL